MVYWGLCVYDRDGCTDYVQLSVQIALEVSCFSQHLATIHCARWAGWMTRRQTATSSNSQHAKR